MTPLTGLRAGLRGVSIVLLTFSPLAVAERIDADMVAYEAHPYHNSDEVFGCGLRLVTMDSQRLFIDASFSLFIFRERIPGAIFKVLATRVSEQRFEGERVIVANAWLEGKDGTRLLADAPVGTGEPGEMMLASFDDTSYTGIAESVFNGEMMIGLTLQDDGSDRLFDIAAPLPASESKPLLDCFQTFLARTAAAPQ